MLGRETSREIDRDLCRADPDTEAVDNTTDDKHGNVLRGADNDASDNPDNGSTLNDDLACEVRPQVRVDYKHMIGSCHPER